MKKQIKATVAAAIPTLAIGRAAAKEGMSTWGRSRMLWSLTFWTMGADSTDTK